MSAGERLTWIEEGAAGEARIDHVRSGDIISIVSLGWLQDGQTVSHKTRTITLDGENKITSLTED